MGAQPTAFVVEDDTSVCSSLRWLLESVKIRVETFAHAEQFLRQYALGTPGCLLADVRLPGMSGLDLQQELQKRDIRLPVIVLTGCADVPMAVRAMKAGAMEFIEKPYDDQKLLPIVQRALELGERIFREQEQELAVRRQLEALSAREREVMSMVIDGKLNKQIAAELHVSIKTVESHRSRVMEKMGARSAPELVAKVLAARGHGKSKAALRPL